MYRVINTQEDLSNFQSDIDKISEWCKMNKMIMNTKKCKIMHITRKKSPLVGEYFIEGQLLESCSPPKFWATQIFWAAKEIWAKPVLKEVSMFLFFEEIDIFYFNLTCKSAW